MKKLFTLILFSLSWFTVFSQQKEMTLEDAVLGRRSYLAPSEPEGLQWRNNQAYVFIKNDTLWQNTIKKDETTPLLTLTDLNTASGSLQFIFRRFPGFSFINENQILINLSSRLLIYNIENEAFSLQLNIPDNAENKDFCKETNQLAYTINNNLYITTEEGETQITNELNKDIIYGQIVDREEFGIEKGTFWSTDGKYLAFYRKDESMVGDYPMVDFMQREAVGSTIKYPMAGMASQQVTVGIYNTETGEVSYLNTGIPDDHYLTNISWGPNDEYIYIAELNRGQDHMQLNQYSVSTGEKTKTLFEETSSTYVEPLHPIIFSKTNPDQFYYWSRKDGWFHIYLYNTKGEQISQITKGNWEVTDIYGTDEKEKYLYYQSTEESPIERQIYKVDITSGKAEKLSESAGTHTTQFSADKAYFIDRWEASDIPGVIDLVNSDGKLLKTIHESENTLSDYKLGENRIFTIKAADNETDLYCRMILPNDLDTSKKYPVIVYVYGGPHDQLIINTWHNDASWWQYYMASKGYIVFTVDGRGSDWRGKAFEEVTYRQLGVVETSDQMKGIEYLKSLPYVDQERIGVHGWSFGGYMTLNLMLRESDTFKVGVAGGPVVDWKMYEVMYGERYMDTPEENPEGFEETSMLNHVKDLQGKLMLIHGVQDNIVLMQHSMQFLRECIKQNKPVDFFAYPTHEHHVTGTDELHLMEKVSQYYFDFL